MLGISYDTPPGLKAFRKKFALPFFLLSDKEKKVSKDYDAAGLLFPKRKTFVLDEKGIILRIYDKINVNTHAAAILKDLKGPEN